MLKANFQNYLSNAEKEIINLDKLIGEKLSDFNIQEECWGNRSY